MPVFRRSPSSDMAEKYRCPICHDLLIEPVSVTCGHTFCMLCLARYTLHSSKTECAQCMKPWTDLPGVNIVLRETIQDLFPAAYEVRKKEHADEAAVVNSFNTSIQAIMVAQLTKTAEETGRVITKFILDAAPLIAVAISIIVGSLVYLFGFGPAETYVVKPVASWTLMDTMQWLEALGEWTKGNLIPTVASLHLDGQGLLGLLRGNSSISVQEFISKETTQHQEILQNTFNYIGHKTGVPPSDFWEFKAIHPLRTLTLMRTVFIFPRLGVLIMLILDYSGSFFPLVHITTGGVMSMYDAMLPALSWLQCLSFMTRLAVFPYLTVYLKFLFVAVWPINPIVALYTGFWLLLRSVIDLNLLIRLVKDEGIRMSIVKNTRLTFQTGMYAVGVALFAGWILPTAYVRLVCSILIYHNFLVLPLLDALGTTELLFFLVVYIRKSSKAELWHDVKDFGTSLKLMLESWLDFMRNDAAVACGKIVMLIYRMIESVVTATLHYARQNALGDLFCLARFLNEVIVGSIRWFALYFRGLFGDTEQ